MYDIRQFRPTVYLLLALGFTGFAVATQTPLLWVVAMALLLLNVWLVKHERFHPLPRWAANILTLAAAGYTGMRIYSDPRPIFPIGNFLVILQLIKLFELRGNRDYAQLLVLSVLLMVSAIISTASLTFGILFLCYVLLSPYAALLFHLKVETDHAKRQMGLDERQADPLTLRQDQRFLNRSMTRLTAMVAAVAIVMAIVVFLFFPRVPGSSLITWQFRPAMAATGMSEQMSMQSVTRVQQNNTEIGSVYVSHNGEPVTGGELYFRGNVYDVYDGNAQSPTRWSWQRAASPPVPSSMMTRISGEELQFPHASIEGQDEDVWVQEFRPLKPTGVSFLLALDGATQISVTTPTRLAYLPQAGVIQLDSPMYRALNYRVQSTGQLVADPVPVPSLGDIIKARSLIDPRIAQYARRPEVSGIDQRGRPLVTQGFRGMVGGRPNDETARIAANIEHHLQTQFTYTLDLANNRPKDDVDDPVVHFLYNSKTGWCEHYAYAMTLMCQSLGMNARLVSGYKVDEYNAMGGYFILRQNQAHAWVEVLIKKGSGLAWERYDPTSGINNSTVARTTSAWTKITHLFDYLEHAWANSVVAYDATAQSGMLDKVENKLLNATIRANTAVHGGGNWFSQFLDWASQSKYTISEGAIVILVIVMALAAIAVIVGYLVQRLRLMRRARRIGLDTLEGAEARRLARQLGFYDDLTRILERRNIERPAHMTPLEFGQSLTFLPAEAYDTIVRLTNVFYQIRFGNKRLSAGQRRSLARVIDRLHLQLSPRPR